MSYDAKRERALTLGPVAPWHTTITVDVVELWRGRHSATPCSRVFEVAAEWTGPPPVGFPPSDRPVSARDVHAVGDLELARAVAKRLLDTFAKGGQPPDLRAVARDLEQAK